MPRWRGCAEGVDVDGDRGRGARHDDANRERHEPHPHRNAPPRRGPREGRRPPRQRRPRDKPVRPPAQEAKGPETTASPFLAPAHVRRIAIPAVAAGAKLNGAAMRARLSDDTAPGGAVPAAPAPAAETSRSVSLYLQAKLPEDRASATGASSCARRGTVGAEHDAEYRNSREVGDARAVVRSMDRGSSRKRSVMATRAM